MAKLDRLLKFTVQSQASDLHISVNSEPLLRLHGTLRKIKYPVLTDKDTEELLFEILTPDQRQWLLEHKSVDFGYEMADVGRFRCNVFHQRLGYAGVFRVVPRQVPTLQQLGMPPVVEKLLNFRQGLILVTGPAGCGKTTTLGAMIHYLNNVRKEHIITVEDPIEIVHQSINCQVNQREVRRHTETFPVALRAALREDPDIILIGEMRDLETISMGITSAETGHLVLGTLHTTSASRTISRLVDVFPPEQMAQIRAMVSESIRGVISQRLLPRKDGKGRVAALEIMVATSAIANMIRENRTFQIPSLMQIGIKQGMRLMDDSLMELLRQDLIHVDDAIEYAEDKKRFIVEKQKLLAAAGAAETAAAPEEGEEKKEVKPTAKTAGPTPARGAEPAEPARSAPPEPRYVAIFEQTADVRTLRAALLEFRKALKADPDGVLRALCAWDKGDASGLRAPDFVESIRDCKARVDLRARALWRVEMSGSYQLPEELRSGPLCRTLVACREGNRQDLAEAIERLTPQGAEYHLAKVKKAVQGLRG